MQTNRVATTGFQFPKANVEISIYINPFLFFLDP